MPISSLDKEEERNGEAEGQAFVRPEPELHAIILLRRHPESEVPVLNGTQNALVRQFLARGSITIVVKIHWLHDR